MIFLKRVRGVTLRDQLRNEILRDELQIFLSTHTQGTREKYGRN